MNDVVMLDRLFLRLAAKHFAFENMQLRAAVGTHGDAEGGAEIDKVDFG